jgi:hypothetical protein
LRYPSLLSSALLPDGLSVSWETGFGFLGDILIGIVGASIAALTFPGCRLSDANSASIGVATVNLGWWRSRLDGLKVFCDVVSMHRSSGH